jgi:processive 1,2-diacylglycerol beta-glucosyltransferase
MKVLIATATAGGGHLAAAAALEEAWRAGYPHDTVRRVDILDFTPKLYRKAYAEGYVHLAERAPELYAHAFRKTDTVRFARKAQPLRRLTARLVTGKFRKELRAFGPDILLAPHFLPLESVGGMSAKERPFVGCVVTDFEAHALWMERCVDLYCVAAEETRARLVARGVSTKKVAVTGIPVSHRFSRLLPRAVTRKILGLNKETTTLLILGGGLGMGPLEETVRQLDRAEAALQLVVVAGRNEALRKRLKSQRYRHDVRILGFANNMHELMSTADLIVTKPGGLTTSEALALGRPLLIVNPLPGQEAANSDFLLERGAAMKVNRLEDLPYRIARLSKSALQRMSRASRALGSPRAAESVCRVVRQAAQGPNPPKPPFYKGGIQ